MTAKQIINAFCLERTAQLSGNKVFPNTYLNRHEADIFEVTKSGYLNEYEVKISRSDFFADFKKKDKHDKLKAGERCNYFTYIVPEGLINPDEVPEYAGFIEVRKIRYANMSDTNIRWTEPRLVIYQSIIGNKLSVEKLGLKHLDKLYESTYHRFHRRIREAYKENNILK